MGDIYVDDNVVCRIHGHLVVAETLLDAGVRAACKTTFLIVVLNHLLPVVTSWAVTLAGNCQVFLPEETKAVGVSATT